MLFGICYLMLFHGFLFFFAYWFFGKYLYRDFELHETYVQGFFALTFSVCVSLLKLMMLEVLDVLHPSYRHILWSVDLVTLLLLIYVILPICFVYAGAVLGNGILASTLHRLRQNGADEQTRWTRLRGKLFRLFDKLIGEQLFDDFSYPEQEDLNTATNLDNSFREIFFSFLKNYLIVFATIIASLFCLPCLWYIIYTSGNFIGTVEFLEETSYVEVLLAHVGVCGVTVVSALAGFGSVLYPYQNIHAFLSPVTFQDVSLTESRLMSTQERIAACAYAAQRMRITLGISNLRCTSIIPLYIIRKQLSINGHYGDHGIVPPCWMDDPSASHQYSDGSLSHEPHENLNLPLGERHYYLSQQSIEENGSPVGQEHRENNPASRRPYGRPSFSSPHLYASPAHYGYVPPHHQHSLSNDLKSVEVISKPKSPSIDLVEDNERSFLENAITYMLSIFGHTTGFNDHMNTTNDMKKELENVVREMDTLEELRSGLFTGLTDLVVDRARYIQSISMIGRVNNVLGWFMTLVCFYRLFMSCLNVLFSRVSYVDPATRILVFVVEVLDLPMDFAQYAPYLSLMLMGYIVLLNVRGFVQKLTNVLHTYGRSNHSVNIIAIAMTEVMALYFAASVLLMRSYVPEFHRDRVTQALGKSLQYASYHLHFDLVFVISSLMGLALILFSHKTKFEKFKTA